MGQSTTPKALALGVSLSLACGLLPGAAFADEAPEDDASANAADSARGTAGGADSAPSGAAAKPDGYDKADFYSDNPVAPIARTLAVPLAATTQLRSLSNEMKYFARFESNQNYDPVSYTHLDVYKRQVAQMIDGRVVLGRQIDGQLVGLVDSAACRDRCRQRRARPRLHVPVSYTHLERRA